MNKLSALLLLAASLPFAAIADVPPPPQPKKEAEAKPAVEGALKEDFQSYDAGLAPDAFFNVQGTFNIVVDGANKVLQCEPDPQDENGVLIGKSVKNGGVVKARIKAGSKRRSHPRYGVGLGGTSGYRLRVVAGEGAVELVLGDMRVKEAAFIAKPDVWYWVELNIAASKTQGEWNVEGRVWEHGQQRPEKASISHTAKEAPPSGKAGLWGAPFAAKPIQFDDVEVTPGPAVPSTTSASAKSS